MAMATLPVVDEIPRVEMMTAREEMMHRPRTILTEDGEWLATCTCHAWKDHPANAVAERMLARVMAEVLHCLRANGEAQS